MYNAGFPKQRLPKSKKNEEWGKQNIDAIIKNSAFASGSHTDYEKQKRYYLGKLDSNDYKYVVNPYNSKKFGDKYPAKIRNYNIIKPIVDLMLGEKSKRPRGIQFMCLNPDALDIQQEMQFKAQLSNLQQMFLNYLNEMGIETGVSSKKVEDPMALKGKMQGTYKDARAVLGQDTYDYLNWFLNLDDLYQQAFKQWLLHAKVVTFKEAVFDDVEYSIVPVDEFDHDRSPGLRYIEDGAWAIHRKRMTITDVLDRFHEELTEDQIDFLEDPNSYKESSYPSFTLDFIRKPGDAGNTTDLDRIVDVYHCVWKTFKKIGFLTYIDENGTIQEMEVSEEYKFDPNHGDIDIRWEWVNEVYHGYRIDKEHYLGIEPFPVQRGSIVNPSKCKLPYNGIIGEQSIVDAGIAYQLLYNIFHYRLELSVAKNKDKILLMEMNTLPKKHGWDEDRFMYTADAAGFAFVDSTAENAGGEKVNFNQWSVLDMSLSNYISAQFELLSAVKNEWEESLGITRQRKGNIMASDGRGNTERSIFQSSVMTQEYFRMADDFELKEAAGLFDTAKIAYAKGKKAVYVIGGSGTKILNIAPGDFEEVELGVAPVNDDMAIENLQTLKSMSLELVQNGMKGSTIAELLESKSMAKIKERLLAVEAAEREWEAQQQQAQLEAQQQATQQQLEIQREDREDKQDHESMENQLDRDKDILIKRMDIGANQNEGVTEMDQNRESLEREKFESDKSFKNRELSHRISTDNKKLALEEKKIQKQSSNQSKTK